MVLLLSLAPEDFDGTGLRAGVKAQAVGPASVSLVEDGVVPLMI
jgi:hypothetical protein